jgi:hypothetical protein
MDNNLENSDNGRKAYIVQFKLPEVGIEHPYDNPDKDITSIGEYLSDHRQFVAETQTPWFTGIINRFFEWVHEQGLTDKIDNEGIFASRGHGTLMLNCEAAAAEQFKSYPAVLLVKEVEAGINHVEGPDILS